MKKKILSILSILLLTMLMITSCASSNSTANEDSNLTNETLEPTKTKQEIELENALRLEEEGALIGAYVLFDDLIENGYYTEYTEKRDSLYYKYEIIRLANMSINYAGLKSQLKDPNSLVIYSFRINVDVDKSGEYFFELEFNYGAANSFGGMVRDTYKESMRSKMAKEYAGKYVNTSFVPLEDIAKMDYYEFENKMCGDYKIYCSTFKWEVPNNIWREEN